MFSESVLDVADSDGMLCNAESFCISFKMLENAQSLRTDFCLRLVDLDFFDPDVDFADTVFSLEVFVDKVFSLEAFVEEVFSLEVFILYKVFSANAFVDKVISVEAFNDEALAAKVGSNDVDSDELDVDEVDVDDIQAAFLTQPL